MMQFVGRTGIYTFEKCRESAINAVGQVIKNKKAARLICLSRSAHDTIALLKYLEIPHTTMYGQLLLCPKNYKITFNYEKNTVDFAWSGSTALRKHIMLDNPNIEKECQKIFIDECTKIINRYVKYNSPEGICSLISLNDDVPKENFVYEKLQELIYLEKKKQKRTNDDFLYPSFDGSLSKALSFRKKLLRGWIREAKEQN